jgi:AbrB family looped-hinge helix DNA binding protein
MDYYSVMALARSRITLQGQISVPAKVRQRLGLGPGSALEWEECNGEIVVRRAGSFSSEDVHRKVFARAPKAKTAAEIKEGIRRRMKKRYAKR